MIDLSLLKGFDKFSVLKIFIIFMKFFLMVAMSWHFYYYDCYKLCDTINLNWMNISFQFFFQNFYLIFPICDKKDFENFLILSMIVSFALTLLSRGSSLWLDLRTPDTKQFSVDKQCSLITSVSNFCYHHQNLLQFTKIITRIHVFWPCLKLHNWCFWSNSTLLSFCAPYRCKHKCLRGICFYSNMEHRHGRQARRLFCSRYRCKYNSP